MCFTPVLFHFLFCILFPNSFAVQYFFTLQKILGADGRHPLTPLLSLSSLFSSVYYLCFSRLFVTAKAENNHELDLICVIIKLRIVKTAKPSISLVLTIENSADFVKSMIVHIASVLTTGNSTDCFNDDFNPGNFLMKLYDLSKSNCLVKSCY